jgi:NADH-quinone oxidoreductase subunit G
VLVEADDSLPTDTVRLATAHPLTAGLGGMFDSIALSQG